MIKRIRFHIFLLLIIFFTLIIYLPILNGFFQQDEWLAFGRHIVISREGWDSLFYNAFLVPGGHFTPLNFISIHILFRIFQLSYAPYVLVSLTLHGIAVFLVYYLSNLLLKNKNKSLITALIFGVLAATYQASTWVVADISTHGATIFGLLSLIFFTKYYYQSSHSKFLLSCLFLTFSLLFKEITLGFFAFFGLLLIFKIKDNRRKFPILILFLFFLIYITIRLYFYFIPQNLGSNDINKFHNSTSRLLYNAVTLPYKSLVQTVIPSDQIVNFSKIIGKFLPDQITGPKNTPDYDRFVEKRILEIVNFLVFLFILIFVIYFISKKESKYKKITFVILIFIFINSLVYALALEKVGILSIVDSRNLYLPSIAISALISILLFSFFERNKIFLIFLLFTIIAVNIFWLEQKIFSLQEEGRIRKEILESINKKIPNLPNKSVFYIESDKSFFGLPPEEKIVPFQSGFGQTLLVYYQKTSFIPSEFYKDRFLWEITSQGYKQVGNRGFGYFRNFEEMAKTLRNNNLSSETVYAFRYDSDSEVLDTITEDIRGGIDAYLSHKREISRSDFKVTPSENELEANLMLDGNRKTFWSSNLAYENPQSLIIVLNKNFKVVQIKIDTNKNPDQKQTNYQIFSSLNGKDWKQVFYSRSIIPDSEGLINIYFKIDDVRYLKIDQIGRHEYAPWVINELEIYEAI